MRILFTPPYTPGEKLAVLLCSGTVGAVWIVWVVWMILEWIGVL